MRSLHGHSRRFWYLHYKQAADLPQCARLHADAGPRHRQGQSDARRGRSDKLIDYVESFTRATVGVRR